MIHSPDDLRRKLGLHFTDPGLFETALTHRSAGSANNERLEFLGDSVLGFVVAERLCEKFPEANEGELSRLRARLVNQDALAELARELDFGNYLVMGIGERKSGGFRRASILSDALEAVIGGVLLDQGFAACRRWILALFAERIDGLTPASGQKDPKTRLQELMQSEGLDLPVYTLIATSGLPHQQCFQVECRVSLLPEPALGQGASRKKAEQQAAELILEQLAPVKRTGRPLS